MIASSGNHRQILETDAPVTPRSITTRCRSTPGEARQRQHVSRGSAHAITLTSTTSSKGKTTRSTRPRLTVNPNQPPGAKPGPSPDDATGRAIQPSRDNNVPHPLGRTQHHPRPPHRPRTATKPRSPAAQAPPLLTRQLHRHHAGPGHDTQSRAPTAIPPDSPQDSRTRLLAGRHPHWLSPRTVPGRAHQDQGADHDPRDPNGDRRTGGESRGAPQRPGDPEPACDPPVRAPGSEAGSGSADKTRFPRKPGVARTPAAVLTRRSHHRSRARSSGVSGAPRVTLRTRGPASARWARRSTRGSAPSSTRHSLDAQQRLSAPGRASLRSRNTRGRRPSQQCLLRSP